VVRPPGAITPERPAGGADLTETLRASVEAAKANRNENGGRPGSRTGGGRGKESTKEGDGSARDGRKTAETGKRATSKSGASSAKPASTRRKASA
jgi:hypothetical protein